MLDVILHYNGKLPKLDNNLVIKYGRNKFQGQYNILETFHKRNPDHCIKSRVLGIGIIVLIFGCWLCQWKPFQLSKPVHLGGKKVN